MKKAFLYKKLLNKQVYPVKSRKAGALPKVRQFNGVKCQACSHYCLILPGKRGFCSVKENIDGELYALNYGKAIALNIDPIEKKPFFHFLPGTESLSIAAVGCNFKCLNCQNHDISQTFKNKKEIPGKNLLPQEIVKIAIKNNLATISYTYTEPTIYLEYALETMKIARKENIKNLWVSNGFFSKQTAQLIIPYLDAINIDIKSFSNDFYKKICQAKLEPVLEIARLMKKRKIWLEITTLIIPGFSDSEKMLKQIALFIKKELGNETPWHVNGFSGAISWKMKNVVDTPAHTLKKAYEIGKKAGLRYVYIGNLK